MTDRRTFLQFMAMAGYSALAPTALRAQQGMEQFYDLPTFGNVSFLHISDLQAQWKSLYYREPDLQLGGGKGRDRPPYVTGDALLQYYNLMIGSAQAYAFSNVDYEASASDYGKLGGVASLMSLIGIVRQSRKDAWLLDGGNGQIHSSAPWASADVSDPIIAALGINAALPTGMPVKEVEPVHDVEYIAHNLVDKDAGKAPFAPYTLTQMNGVSVAVIGQVAHNELSNQVQEHSVVALESAAELKSESDSGSKPDPAADPVSTPGSDFVAKLDAAGLQQIVNEVRQKGARAVLLLSRAGVEADLKLASRIIGIDVILGGRSVTPLPEPISVSNKAGKTLVTNAGAQGRFLAVLDMQVGKKGMTDFRYNLLPVVESFVKPDRRVAALIDQAYLASKDKLAEKLAVSEGVLYRRGTFNGTWDEVLLQAMLQETGSQVALFPGYRWGATVPAGTTLTREDVINQTALGEENITYGLLRGDDILKLLEEAADDCFNVDAYKRTERDMLRTGGVTYGIDPRQAKGRRITNVMIEDKPLESDGFYKVVTWGVSVKFESQTQRSLESEMDLAANDRVEERKEKSEAAKEPLDSSGGNGNNTGANAGQSQSLQDLVVKYLKQKKNIATVKAYHPDVVHSIR